MDYKTWKKERTDKVILFDGHPIPSFLEINISPTCNRKCEFCPRAHGWKDEGSYMSVEQTLKIKKDLEEIGFEGILCFCGFGEPLQNPNVSEIIRSVKSSKWTTELVTNGDFLTREIAEIPDHVSISMYDGPHQIEKFENLLNGLSHSLRERWQSFDTLTNRSGYVNYGGEIDVTKPCNYPLYYMYINHNGDTYLCPQDWSKKYILGNVFSNHLMDVWKDLSYQKYRKVLLENRDISPCKNCNTCGTMYGNSYRDLWMSLA